MILDRAADTDHNAKRLETRVCALCGAVRGEDFQCFADHVLTEHTPADAGLGDEVPAPACGKARDLTRWQVRDLRDRPGTHSSWCRHCFGECDGHPPEATERVLISPEGRVHAPAEVL